MTEKVRQSCRTGGMRYRVEEFHTGCVGWGVRAYEGISRGAFVFEMTKEVLTNVEEMARNKQYPNGPAYSMQINTEWAAERVFDDNSALCLDAGWFGNVIRFVNHSYASLTK